MASKAIDVFPVARSPRISSRWPRPNGSSASITLVPVCIGSWTGCRSMTPGASRSTGQSVVARMSGPPSSGRPKASTTRPSNGLPTGTLATRPVARNSSPAATCSLRSRNRTPISSRRRSKAMAVRPSWRLEKLAVTCRRAAAEIGDAVADTRHPPRLVASHLKMDALPILPQLCGQLPDGLIHGYRLPQAGN